MYDIEKGSDTMINQVVLVGKIKGIEEGSKYKGNLFVEIERPFKDTYKREFDVIECSFWESLFNRVVNGCRDGDLIAIRGRIENEDNKYYIAVENVVLLNKSRDNILKMS